MSSQQQTTGQSSNSLSFNPIAQGIYNNLIQGGSGVLSGYMNNPLGNPLYQMGLGQSQKGAQQLGANNMAALTQNQLVQGLGGNAGAGWLNAQKAQTGRANQSLLSQANIGNVMQAFNRQLGATGLGMSFSPQLTGSSGTSSQTSTTSGLGTWLPQLLGGGLAAGLGIASMAGGGGGAAPSIMPSSFSSSFGGSNPVSGLTSPFGTMGSMGFGGLMGGTSGLNFPSPTQNYGS